MNSSMVDSVFLFYKESTYPHVDKYFKGDRYLRRILNILLHGRIQRMTGHKKVYVNLKKGLHILNKKVICNKIGSYKKNPEWPLGFIGKGYYLEKIQTLSNPILLGPGVIDHPKQNPNLINKLNCIGYVAPSIWYSNILKEFWGEKVYVWPVGIDTVIWKPISNIKKIYDVLIYDKISNRMNAEFLITNIEQYLERKKINSIRIMYGYYNEDEFKRLVHLSKSVIFLSRNETQGIAYQEMMSAGLPVLAFDPGFWEGAHLGENYTDIGKYPASSVPYFDERCGKTFSSYAQFIEAFEIFWENVLKKKYKPRDYVMEHLTLEKCASRYLDLLLK